VVTDTCRSFYWCFSRSQITH